MDLSENEQNILDEMEHDFGVASVDTDRRSRLRSRSTDPSHAGVHWTGAMVACIATAVGLRLAQPAGIALAVSGYALLGARPRPHHLADPGRPSARHRLRPHARPPTSADFLAASTRRARTRRSDMMPPSATARLAAEATATAS